jgi:hypothetical protein
MGVSLAGWRNWKFKLTIESCQLADWESHVHYGGDSLIELVYVEAQFKSLAVT